MPEWSHLATFAVASFILGITPGPDIIYVIVRGAAQGPRAGVAAAAGLCTGIIGHTLLCIVGLTAVLAASAIAFTAVKVLGAAYLIYLGVRMWRHRDKLDFSNGGDPVPIGSIYRQTVVMNLLNPKVALFFLAFLPQFVDPGAGPVAYQFAILGFIFMAVSFVVMATAGLAGGQVRRFFSTSENAGRRIHALAGTVLIALGIRLAMETRI